MGLPFFIRRDGRPIMPTELTPLHTSLLSWLEFYSWIGSSEGPPRPDDAIYNDDNLLDNYIYKWTKKFSK